MRCPSAPLTVAILLLGCSTGRGAPGTQVPPGWVAGPCFIADTTAPVAETLYVIGAAHEGPSDWTGCAGLRERPSLANAPTVVAISAPPGADLRDILDVGLAGKPSVRPDVVVTSDPDVIAYAVLRDGAYLVSALPWASTYALVVPRADSIAMPPPAERQALARDAVTADARGAMEPFPWRIDASCATLSQPTATAARPVVAYATGDATARELAERVVSLAGAASRPPWLSGLTDERGSARAALYIAPMHVDSIAYALASGRAAAAVLPVMRDPRTRCGTPGDVPIPSHAVPLIDTRAHVIVRRGSGAAFIIAPDGSLRFTRPQQR